MKKQDDLGNRMKSYEEIPRIHLTPRMPIIIRCDGKAFHTFTRGFNKPWDDKLQEAMTQAAFALMNGIQGAEMAYIQSDEISILLNTYKTFDTQQYFGGNIQKISSVAASIATAYFNQSICKHNLKQSPATFDARCFVVPKEDVNNYFLWRQKDAIRNSISGYAQSNFSHKDLHKKSQLDMKKMLADKDLNWENVSIKNQRGWCIVRELKEKIVDDNKVMRSLIVEDNNIPLFDQVRDYVNKFLIQVES